jgi:hypothetical protein
MGVALLLAFGVASGCVGNGATSEPAARAEPRMGELRYDCGDGESLHLAGDGVTLVATDSQETRVRLHASPPGQDARYGAEGHALVLDGGEALWMKAGEAPMTCRR